MKKILLSIILCLLIIVNVSAKSKKDSNKITEKDVKEVIERMETSFNSIMKNDKLSQEEKNQEYKKLTSDLVDSQWIAKFILGTHWRELKPAQRKEFHDLYKEYLISNYMPKLQDFNQDLTVDKVKKQRKDLYMAYCTTKDLKNRDIKVEFRVIERDNNLYITDIIPEGISFISSQRTAIDSALTQKGYDEFIEDLKSKIKNISE